MTENSFDDLQNLAHDLLWSWNHGADKIWQEIDGDVWDLTHNPQVVLQTASREKLKKLLADPDFSKRVNDLLHIRKGDIDAPTWFKEHHADTSLKCVAYFSMEYMLSESLPIYSGGLGNVAGDQLKAASDLGVPVIGIGLLYQQGYFRQVIDKDGNQQALYPYNDPGQLPITPVRKPDGEWLRLKLEFQGWNFWVRAWQAKVGRTTLYLLDSNDPANLPANRSITSELYGGSQELRLQQEMMLGICGWRLMTELGLDPEVCHLNEGHAALAILDRAYSFMKANKVPFKVALAATRVGNLFTTHTAVPAGFDRFTPQLIEQYLGTYAQKRLGLSLKELLALGRQNPDDDNEPFNMAYLAIRGSGAVNGVSWLHGKVSRHLFNSLFPNWPEDEVPIGHITNGVHMPTWDSKASDDLWTKACGKGRWLGKPEDLERQIKQVPDNEIWQMRNESRANLVNYARKRISFELARRGYSEEEVEKAKNHFFDPNTLILGFARRFATYKRPNMLLSDPDRLIRILTNHERPVQLILAGKAHPADIPGQEMIRQWIQFVQRPEVRPHVIFLSDYDMLLTEQLVEGVDVWLNTPRRPWEACGTSGMKLLVNGGLNLSELDGWWAEAYKPEVGWALGDGKEHSDPAWDKVEANQLYELLEEQVIPEFYSRDAAGIPVKWIGKIRESMANLTPRFSANRAVIDYTEHHYLPAAKAYRERNTAQAQKIVDWKHEIERNWHVLRFGSVNFQTRDNQHHFEVTVYLNDLEPGSVKCELYADGEKPFVLVMERIKELPGKTFVFQGSVPASRPGSDYTARIVPFFEGVYVPLEAQEILWQH